MAQGLRRGGLTRRAVVAAAAGLATPALAGMLDGYPLFWNLRRG